MTGKTGKTASCELLLPGGSLASASAALEGGADAIYLGLSSFSARKGAQNFSWEDLDRLRGSAGKSGKKIYVALNTLIADRELEAFLETAALLAERRVDAVILQDPGLAWLLRQNFPTLQVHASTQMGIHNLPGMEEAARLGISRVVLSRELTLEEIRLLREGFPEMELEVFIHGALCYGFSGLCLASGTLLDRSANRGECAQVCRTWFQGPGGRKAYDFSTNDLALGPRIRDLSALGVQSFKVEGRMKGPEYARAAARWYRGILDGLSEEDLKLREEHLRLAFGRKPTTGFITGAKGQDLLGTDFPSSRGIPAGSVKRVRPGAFLLTLETDLHPRDGLGFWMGPGQEYKTAVREVRDQTGRRLVKGSTGQTLWIEADDCPEPGQVVFKTSRHDGLLPQINPQSFPLKPLEVDLSIRCEPSGLHLMWRGPLGTGSFFMDAPLEPSEQEEGFGEALRKVFSVSEGLFTLGDFTWENSTGWPGVFLPPKSLKQLRRDFYSRLKPLWSQVRQERIKKVLSNLEGFPTTEPWASVPPGVRETFTPWDVRQPGWRYLPALEFSLEGRNGLLSHWQKDPAEGEEFVGLNNLSQLNLVRRLRGDGAPPGRRLRFFCDYGLYAANRVFSLWLTTEFPEVEALTPWIERPQALEHSLLPSAHWASGRPLPLFYSRVCWRRHSLGEPCAGCTGWYEEEITQGKTRFRVSGQDCLTLVYRLSGSPTPGAGRS